MAAACGKQMFWSCWPKEAWGWGGVCSGGGGSHMVLTPQATLVGYAALQYPKQVLPCIP